MIFEGDNCLIILKKIPGENNTLHCSKGYLLAKDKSIESISSSCELKEKIAYVNREINQKILDVKYF